MGRLSELLIDDIDREEATEERLTDYQIEQILRGKLNETI